MNLSVHHILIYYIRTKYILIGTYSVMHVYVHIISTRHIHHDAYSTYLYIFVHICVHDMNKYILVGVKTLYSNLKWVSIWSAFVHTVCLLYVLYVYTYSTYKY